MKTTATLLLLLALSYLVNAQNKAEELYNSAIYQEEIVGNLNQAIVLYAKLVDQFPGERIRSIVGRPAAWRRGVDSKRRLPRMAVVRRRDLACGRCRQWYLRDLPGPAG